MGDVRPLSDPQILAWRGVETVWALAHDAPMAPKTVRSTVLTAEEEATIVAFRKHTLLPLDDCLYALQATVPHLTRSSLHHCFQRDGISRLPEVAGDKPAKQPFKRYPIGYFHIDIAEVRTEEGKLYLFVAVDRTSKFAFARLMQKATTVTASAFLDELVEAVPYKIHTVLTDNGIQFADLPKNRHVDAGNGHQTLHAFIFKGRAGKIALDDLEVIAQPIELAQMPVDSEALVFRHNLFTQPGPALGAAQVCM